MYEDDIKKVDEWFDRHTESYGTYHSHSENDDEYSVDAADLGDFSDFLRENFPDLIGIRCFFGKGESAIWFFRSDLKEARFY